MEQVFFYILAAVAILSTILAITERHAVHAIMYLVLSFFALAVVFWLLAAPLIAAFEVIIYAGAIMVLFLFIIMMLDLGHPESLGYPSFRDWGSAALLGSVIAVSTIALAVSTPSAGSVTSGISIRDFSVTLFTKYGIAVEIVSMQLLFALVGALYYGRSRAGGRYPSAGNSTAEIRGETTSDTRGITE